MFPSACHNFSFTHLSIKPSSQISPALQKKETFIKPLSLLSPSEFLYSTPKGVSPLREENPYK